MWGVTSAKRQTRIPQAHILPQKHQQGNHKLSKLGVLENNQRFVAMKPRPSQGKTKQNETNKQTKHTIFKILGICSLLTMFCNIWTGETKADFIGKWSCKSLLTFMEDIWKIEWCSGWCSSVDWAWAHEPRGQGSIPTVGHMPGLQARSPTGDMWEATTH